MKLTITSTDKDVTFYRSPATVTVYAKNTVYFNVNPKSVIFTAYRERFEIDLKDIEVNGEQLTVQNAKDLLSDAVFRKASEQGSGSGGENGTDLSNYYTKKEVENLFEIELKVQEI